MSSVGLQKSFHCPASELNVNGTRSIEQWKSDVMSEAICQRFNAELHRSVLTATVLLNNDRKYLFCK